MTRTLAEKVIEGILSQGWEIIGRGGTWAGAMRPLEEYVKRKVERAVQAEREACAKVCDPEPSLPNEAYTVLNNKATMRRCAAAIRARGEKK